MKTTFIDTTSDKITQQLSRVLINTKIIIYLCTQSKTIIRNLRKEIERDRKMQFIEEMSK